MPRIRDCVICGKRFTSYHGINVCSEQCKIEKKKRQDENSNKRRYSKESNTPIIKSVLFVEKSLKHLEEHIVQKSVLRKHIKYM